MIDKLQKLQNRALRISHKTAGVMSTNMQDSHLLNFIYKRELQRFEAPILKEIKSNFKSIFHCDAKPFALGLGVGGLSQFCHGETNMLASKNAKICVTPNAKPKI